MCPAGASLNDDVLGPLYGTWRNTYADVLKNSWNSARTFEIADEN